MSGLLITSTENQIKINQNWVDKVKNRKAENHKSKKVDEPTSGSQRTDLKKKIVPKSEQKKAPRFRLRRNKKNTAKQ